MRTWLFLLVTACVIPLLLFSATLLVRHTSAETAATEAQVGDRARLLRDDIDRELARMLAVGEVLALSESLSTGDLAGFYRYAARIRDLLGTNVLIRDLSSQQLVNTRVPWGTTLPRNPVFEVDRSAVETRRPQISNLLTGAVSKQPLLIVVVPVIRNDEVTYLLSLTLSLERLQAILAADRLPSGWVAGLTDRDGVVIGRSKGAAELVGTSVPAETWTRIKDFPKGIDRTSNLDGVMSLQAYERSEASGWLVGLSVPESLVSASSQETLTLFVSGGGLLFLVGLGVALFLARRLTSPISQLVGAARTLGAGHPLAGHPLTVAPPGIAEIKSVGEALQDAAVLIDERTTALQESEARLRRVVEGAPFPAIVHAEDGEIIYLSRAWTEASGYQRHEIPTIGEWRRRAHEEGVPPPSDIDRLYHLDRPLDEGEYTIRAADGRDRTWAFRSAPIGCDGTGRRLVVSMAADLTERKEAEAHMRLLMQEVDHRAKNALAVVQSIVILSRAENSADFAEVVQGRVAAVARAHTLLAETRWSGADLATLARQELEAHALPGQFRILGAPVTIVAPCAQAVSIVLHELTINAVKHGALSVSTGRVTVSIAVNQRSGGLIVDWNETGGPAVTPPTRRGFGSVIIERTVRDQLAGEIDFDWHPGGLRFRMALPADYFMISGIIAAPAIPKPANDETIRRLPGARVLLVEDEALTAIAMAQAVEEAGYRVLGPVGRVQDGIDIARNTRPDAAVLDVNLLGQPSFPIARALNAMGVPFLFCTGYNALNDADAALRNAPVLTKPVDPGELVDAIAALLASRSSPEAGRG
ncbi:MAG TPA: HWE histidine kinase domain-containing protein [Skermanella sp.]|nr:HWE histidine kinase domain-containing protein [Skermanella sp.]